MLEGSITIQISAEVQEIERLNRLVRQFGEFHDIPGRTLYAVNLALDEVVSNVVLYGYDNPHGQKITVKLIVEGDQLHAAVEDSGRAFDPHSLPAADLHQPLQARQVGGLGIHLVRSLMDVMEYKRSDAKNLLTLRKKIR